MPAESLVLDEEMCETDEPKPTEFAFFSLSLA